MERLFLLLSTVHLPLPLSLTLQLSLQILLSFTLLICLPLPLHAFLLVSFFVPVPLQIWTVAMRMISILVQHKYSYKIWYHIMIVVSGSSFLMSACPNFLKFNPDFLISNSKYLGKYFLFWRNLYENELCYWYSICTDHWGNWPYHITLWYWFFYYCWPVTPVTVASRFLKGKIFLKFSSRLNRWLATYI